ncbi:MAG: SxtJ family membrane protein [Myxococcota bacterium]
MSKMVEINWQPDERTLRQFGWIALGGFGLVALLAWNEWLVFSGGLGAARKPVVGVLAGLGLLSAIFSLVAPRANKPIFLGLTLLSYPIGFVLSYVIMGFLFYGLITPVGLVFRLIGKDPLHRRFDPQAATYWTDPRPRRGKDSYFRQF